MRADIIAMKEASQKLSTTNLGTLVLRHVSAESGHMHARHGQVYILTNHRRTVLYIGVTSDIHKRIWEHRNHGVAGFASKYKCDILVHLEFYERVADAISRAKQLKHWTRARKEALIAERNPSWRSLDP